MLDRISSLELAEWRAYERHAGPLGNGYGDETLAALHEQLQRANHLLGAAHFTDKKHRKNPVPKPEKYPRPSEVLRSVSSQDPETMSAGTEDGEPDGHDH